MSGQFKAFVSEEEVQEQRQKRQAEWEKVRKPDDPVECPEEETRSLFEQLQANKDQRDREFEEENRTRSSVKGLDDDEAQFLNFVSDRQMQIEKERKKEEQTVMNELKMMKAQDKEKVSTSDTAKPSSASTATAAPSTSKNTQKQLLLGAIKRKSTDSKVETEEKKQKTEDETDSPDERPDARLMAGIPKTNGTTMVVAGILPGIADYDDSDSSTENDSNSSDSEEDHKIMPNTTTQRVLQDMMRKLKEDSCG